MTEKGTGFVDWSEKRAGGTPDLLQPDAAATSDIRKDSYGRPWTVFVQPDHFPTAYVACMWANGKGVPDERVELLRNGEIWYYHREAADDASWYMQIGTVATGLARKICRELGLEVK